MSAANFREIGKKILCIGRNYKAHASELMNPLPQKPIVFLKPTSSYISEGSPIVVPKDCTSLHHEVELGLVIEKPGRNISRSSVYSHIGGYVLALDMTARNLQEKAVKEGNPWTLSKGFDTSCPISEFMSCDKIQDPQNISLWLKVNGCLRQEGNTKDMIFSIITLVEYLSLYFTLETGDVVLTGTPSGIGPTVPGDSIQCGLGDILSMQFSVCSEH